MKFSFLKLHKQRKFNFTPRYWDADKEEREARNKEIAQELGVNTPSDKPYSPNIKGQFRKNKKNADSHSIGVVQSYSKKVSRVIMLITILLLCVMIYFLMHSYPFLLMGK